MKTGEITEYEVGDKVRYLNNDRVELGEITSVTDAEIIVKQIPGRWQVVISQEQLISVKSDQ